VEKYEDLLAAAKLRNESAFSFRRIHAQETFVFIFPKRFNADLNELVGIQPFYLRRDLRISTLTRKINDMMEWDQGSEDVMPAGTTSFDLVLFKESPFGKLDMSRTFAENSITRGDIIWFWRAPLQRRLTTSVQILMM
jgi:hypothetical protein